MIESNIVKWIDLGDSMQSLDVYGKQKWVKFFNFIRVLVGFKSFAIFFYIILKCFYFLQILMLNLTNLEDENDNAVLILKYVAKVIFVQDIITDESSYKIAVIVNSVFTVLSIMCLIYLSISVRIGKFYIKIPISLLNLICVVVMHYLIGPIVQISIMSTNCPSGNHLYLQVLCYSNYLHIIFITVSMLNLIFFLGLSLILSIYYNEIGSVNETKVCARINCNYEVYTNISKISMFVFAYFVKFYGSTSDVYKIILQVYILLNCFTFSIYVYRTVLFYDSRMNTVILYGWIFVTWFSAVILLKTLLKLNDTSIFHIVGWIMLAFIIYFLEEFKEEYLLTDFNIFDAKSLKDIELFNLTLFNLMNMRSVKNKTLLIGIIKKFEEYVKSNEELNEKYMKLSSNEHLKKKFNSSIALSILSIVYIIYDHHLDKSALKNDILLNMCYFLMNKFKNVTFAVSLCSRLKVTNHKHLYFKFILMEEIKSSLINKLSKSNNKESIKHVQIGSVILYNIYMDLFKIKIYDAACNQIDYFDILRNTVNTPKTTENFLKIGEDILSLRKEILKLWEKIVELNPFSDESEKDYMLYLETILQDDVLARTEAKKFSVMKTNKLSERNNIYHSMFNKDSSSIILVDGYSSNGKILYTTPNFPQQFNFSGKEILNMSVEDLVPNVVAQFHKELIENAIKFSNMSYIFLTQRDFLLKGKTFGIYNVKVYNKCIPNLSYGLIYMIHLTKIQDHNYIIVLDKDFKINGLTDMLAQGPNAYTTGGNYGLTNNIINHSIALVLPEILLQMEWQNNVGFIIPKSDIDLKGNLYPVAATKDLDNKVEKVLERIKQMGKLQTDTEQKQETIQEYDELLKDISSKNPKPHSVFYRIVTKSFLDDKYKYHRIYISNDLIALNENTNSYPSALISSGINKNVSKQPKLKKESKITSLAEIKDSQKQIKLRVGNHFQSEQNRLLGEPGDKKEGDEKDKGNNELEKKDDVNNILDEAQAGADFSKPSSSSAVSKSSIDSASFNKLKNGILEKKEISSVKIMRYLCFAFGGGTIILIFFASQISNQNFTNLNNYLSQNLYFNHSKIAVSCLYLSSLNLKFLKYQFYQNSYCYIPCKAFYSNLLTTCISDIKKEKENSSYFYDDFRKILGQTKEIELELFNLSSTVDTLEIDAEGKLNLLVAFGLKLNSNMESYLKSDNSVYDVTSKNLLTQSLNYVNDQNIAGFSQSTKELNLSSDQFSPIPIILLVEAAMFILLTIAFICLIFSLYRMEIFYLVKLVNFSKANFELYLKRLDELKKKLRNDNGEEEEKLGDVDMNDLNSKKGSKNKEEEEENKDNKKEKKKKKDDKEKDENEEKEKDEKKEKKIGHRGKKGKSVQNKAATARLEKIRMMSNYFCKWNFFLCLKVVVVLIVSVSYYFVVFIIDTSTKEDILSFDSTTNAVEGIYKSSFDIFLLLKTELAKYADYEITKKKYAQYLSNNPHSSILFQGKTYQSADDLILNGTKYLMSFPANNQIATPKLGNLLMPLVNDLTSATSAILRLNNLYNKDACAVLFDSTIPAPSDYSQCGTIWSTILLKGMEQSITQMSVIINTVLDELNSLNLGKKAFAEVLNPKSSFSQYEVFVEFYLFKSYIETVNIFRELDTLKLNTIFNLYQAIMIGYMVGVVLLFFLMLYFVYSSKVIFNTFLNFIGILPVKYLIEDEMFYKDILKLEQYI